MTALSDEMPPIADGELWVKPLGLKGDPFAIFADPAQARRMLLPAHSKLGAFPEASSHLFLGANLVVDLGRQTLANLVGGRDFPNKNWIVTKCSWGTHDTVPRFTDTTLSPQPTTVSPGGLNEIVYAVDGLGNELRKKLLYSVDWPQPFIIRYEAILEASEANGTLLKEMALWSDNERLFARKVFPAISKNNSFGLSFLWRVRF